MGGVFFVFPLNFYQKHKENVMEYYFSKTNRYKKQIRSDATQPPKVPLFMRIGYVEICFLKKRRI